MSAGRGGAALPSGSLALDLWCCSVEHTDPCSGKMTFLQGQCENPVTGASVPLREACYHRTRSSHWGGCDLRLRAGAWGWPAGAFGGVIPALTAFSVSLAFAFPRPGGQPRDHGASRRGKDKEGGRGDLMP